MEGKVTIWTKIEQLSTFIKTVMVFVPVIGVAVTWLTIHDNKLVTKMKENQEQVKFTSDFNKMSIAVDTISNRLTRHITTQNKSSEKVTKKLEDVIGKQDRLRDLVTTEFSKSMTPKQVREMMNLFIDNENEKKNYGPDSYLILQDKNTQNLSQ